ncbi:MAG: hypothetical protein Q8P82_02825, partial [bacterium]|nr:hypothetical protein [bacterium]
MDTEQLEALLQARAQQVTEQKAREEQAERLTTALTEPLAGAQVPDLMRHVVVLAREGYHGHAQTALELGAINNSVRWTRALVIMAMLVGFLSLGLNVIMAFRTNGAASVASESAVSVANAPSQPAAAAAATSVPAPVSTAVAPGGSFVANCKMDATVVSRSDSPDKKFHAGTCYVNGVTSGPTIAVACSGKTRGLPAGHGI